MNLRLTVIFGMILGQTVRVSYSTPENFKETYRALLDEPVEGKIAKKNLSATTAFSAIFAKSVQCQKFPYRRRCRRRSRLFELNPRQNLLVQRAKIAAIAAKSYTIQATTVSPYKEKL